MPQEAKVHGVLWVKLQSPRPGSGRPMQALKISSVDHDSRVLAAVTFPSMRLEDQGRGMVYITPPRSIHAFPQTNDYPVGGCPSRPLPTPRNNPIDMASPHPLAPMMMGRFQFYPPTSERYRTLQILGRLPPLIRPLTPAPKGGNV